MKLKDQTKESATNVACLTCKGAPKQQARGEAEATTKRRNINKRSSNKKPIKKGTRLCFLIL